MPGEIPVGMCRVSRGYLEELDQIIDGSGACAGERIERHEAQNRNPCLGS